MPILNDADALYLQDGTPGVVAYMGAEQVWPVQQAGVPSNVVVAATGEVGELVITWDPTTDTEAPAGDGTYRVQYEEPPDSGSWVNIDQSSTSFSESHVFTGGSGSRQMRVRANGDEAVPSTNSAYIRRTDTPNWTPAPPAPPTMTDWRPNGGTNMYAVWFTMPADAAVNGFKVEYTDAAGAWVTTGPVVAATPGQVIAAHSVFTAEAVPGDAFQSRFDSVRVVVSDSFGQTAVGQEGSYELKDAVVGINADYTGHYHEGDYSGGADPANWNRNYQGWFSDPAKQYWGYIYYGTQINDWCKRTNTWGEQSCHVTRMDLNCERTGGDGLAGDLYIGTHDLKVNPGFVTEPKAPFFDTASVGVMQPVEIGQYTIPTVQSEDLRTGVHWGLGMNAEPFGGKPYMFFIRKEDNPGHGAILIYTWG